MFIVLQKSSRSSPEEIQRNDANNKDDAPNICHFDSHPVPDDCNKESYKNKSPDRLDKSTKQNLANNTSYSEGVLKCLFFLIYCLKQFVHCKEHQASDGKVIYQYTASLSIVSVYFNIQVIQELYSMIHLWKELCNVVIQYWPEGVECLEEVPDDEIQQWKKLEQAVLLQCFRGLCGSSSMLQYWDLDHFFSLPVDLNLLNNPRTFATLQIAKFGSRFFDDVLLVRNTASTSPTVPNLFVSIFGSFPCHYKLLLNQHFKSFRDMGRQASDRGNNNRKQSQSETSKRSGSAGSNTSSSTTGGDQDGSIRRTGSTGSCGSPGRGDDEDDGGQKRDRPSRYNTYNNTPCALQWEEEDSNNRNETASATTAPWPLSGDDPCSEPGKSKTKKPRKTAAPIMYELVIRCSNGLDMLAVTSPMMNLPLSGDDPYDELPAATTAASNEIFTVRCCCEVNIYCGKVW